jgi:mRNA-degrading endonuclease RelE of RelBE toxin-antitoxin system
MSYTLFVSPTGHRSLKKLPKDVKQVLEPEIRHLVEDPLRGSQLQGVLRFLRSLHIISRGVHYRVAYEVNETSREILIHYVSTRENFYKELQRLDLKKLAKSV